MGMDERLPCALIAFTTPSWPFARSAAMTMSGTIVASTPAGTWRARAGGAGGEGGERRRRGEARRGARGSGEAGRSRTHRAVVDVPEDPERRDVRVHRRRRGEQRREGGLFRRPSSHSCALLGFGEGGASGEQPPRPSLARASPAATPRRRDGRGGSRCVRGRGVKWGGVRRARVRRSRRTARAGGDETWELSDLTAFF